MKNRILSLTSIATLAVVFGMISWGSAFAQTAPSSPADQTPSQAQPAAPSTPDTPPSQQTPQTQPTPTPDNPPATQQTPSSQTPSQAPDQAQPQPPSSDNGMPPAGSSSAGAAAASDSQTFSGTVVKSGDKYMLKDDSGKTYDIDHQSDVAKFEGKRVRVKGVLDASGSKILVK